MIGRGSDGLLMLGIIHRDREGVADLQRWLDSYRPDAVTLEFSRYGLRFRRACDEVLRHKVKAVAEEMVREGYHVEGRALDDILAYIDPPCEYGVASGYAARHGVPLHLIDLDRFSRAELAHIGDLLSTDNLRKLFSGPVVQRDRREKVMARLFFEKGVVSAPYSKEMAVRDRHMSRRIRRLQAGDGEGRFMHICGWQHLRDPLNIYDPLNPIKAFVYDKTLRF
jgi:hypothetical protein